MEAVSVLHAGGERGFRKKDCKDRAKDGDRRKTDEKGFVRLVRRAHEALGGSGREAR
jgi:hypothetical protein